MDALREIKEHLRIIRNKGTEPDPSYYARILISIYRYGGLNDEQISRYSKYLQSDIKKLTEE